AYGVSPDLKMFDITHQIPTFDIWAAAYRLNQTASYWPAGTVFVSVVDPGVGTDRRSVVLKTKTGHYFVTPDNGSLTLVADDMGIEAVREIDEAVNRLKNSDNSYTFHGRDVYAYTGARLAAGVISFEQVGKRLADKVRRMDYQHARLKGKVVAGNIPILDVHYGNVWTNVSRDLLFKLKPGVLEFIWVEITHDKSIVFKEQVPFVNTFGQVELGKPVIYINDLLNAALAINQGDFAGTHSIESGPDWNVRFFR
ncbi:MAG: SAM-dependent chlorinase/fluorinase, partial [Verrucomicrobia bacterium]|nr:SAM-dependent chlorinase/fluorinase [Verrucomicrobiota bacterium]